MITIKLTELTKIAEKNLMLPLRNIPDLKYEQILERGIPLRYFIKKIASGVRQEYKENGNIPYIAGEDIDDYGFIYPTKYIDDSPLCLRPGTIFTGRVGSVGKVGVLDFEATCSDNILYMVLKEDKFSNYLKWFFLSPLGKYQLNKITKGKSQPVINKTNLLRFRVLTPNNIDDVTKKILNFEKEISQLKIQIKEFKLIVDEVFSKYFKLDLKQHSNLEKKRIFGENLLNLSKSVQLRSSLKFHHPKFDFGLEKIKEFKTVKLKQLLKEPVRRGVQPEYEEEGEIQVIKTTNLRNGYIDLSEAEYVNNEFFNRKRKKAGIKYLDILIASTGTGSIGKVDIWESDDEALADGHISIIRANQDKVNPYYLTYYLRSIFGYCQIEANFSGMSNQIEIYPNDIEKFEILIPDKIVQDQIVKEIEDKLNEQKKIMEQIEKLKQEIDNLIEKAILEEQTKNDWESWQCAELSICC